MAVAITFWNESIINNNNLDKDESDKDNRMGAHVCEWNRELKQQTIEQHWTVWNDWRIQINHIQRQ